MPGLHIGDAEIASKVDIYRWRKWTKWRTGEKFFGEAVCFKEDNGVNTGLKFIGRAGQTTLDTIQEFDFNILRNLPDFVCYRGCK